MVCDTFKPPPDHASPNFAHTSIGVGRQLTEKFAGADEASYLPAEDEVLGARQP